MVQLLLHEAKWPPALGDGSGAVPQEHETGPPLGSRLQAAANHAVAAVGGALRGLITTSRSNPRLHLFAYPTNNSLNEGNPGDPDTSRAV
ncbi:hypothetical protein HaLaN_06354, partial [Haematococcus lacustris]